MNQFKVGDKVRFKDTPEDQRFKSRWFPDFDVLTIKRSCPSYVSFEGTHYIARPRRLETVVELAKPIPFRSPRGFRASHPVNRTVLKHLLRRKSISPLEALMTYGISRLAPAIHDLRSAGHTIKSEIRKDAKGHRYARYTLTTLAA